MEKKVTKVKEEVEPKSAYKRETDYMGIGWKPGTSAQELYEIVVSAGKTGVSKPELMEKAEKMAEKGKLTSSNLKGRVDRLFKAIAQRGLADIKDGRLVTKYDTPRTLATKKATTKAA